MISRVIGFTAFGVSICAHAAQIEIGPGVCETLVNYVEPPGVEYQPGIDADGNAVPPADVAGTPPLRFPQHIVIPVSDYLAGRLAGTSAATGTAAATSGVVQPQALLGTITVDGTHLAFNGQPLNPDVDGDLGKLCEKALQGGR